MALGDFQFVLEFIRVRLVENNLRLVVARGQDQPETNAKGDSVDLFAFESDGARCVRGSIARSSRTRKGLAFAEATPKAFAERARGKGTEIRRRKAEI